MASEFVRVAAAYLGVEKAMDLAGLLVIPNNCQYTARTDTAAATLTAAQAVGAQQVVVNMTGALAAGAALNLPATAALIAALPWTDPNVVKVGTSFVLRVINNSSGAYAWTLTAGDANTTISGTATIAQNTFRDFLVKVASATTITIQNIGSGSN